MRKKQSKKRALLPDPKFNDQLVTRFVNNLMLQGKKSTAYKVFYDAIEIVELIYQKGKFDYNREIIEEIQNKKFDNLKFEELAGSKKEYSSINSIEDDKLIDINSVKMLYALPVNSFALVNKEDKIYLVKITGTNKNSFNETDEKYIKFVNEQNTNNRKSILQSYDQLLNDKYQVQLNQKTIDRVKNYFK